MDTQWPRWEVFKQDTPSKPHQAVGSVHAADPEHALLTARNVFARRPLAVSLWVVRAEDIFSWTKEELAQNPPPEAVSQTESSAIDFRPSTFCVFRKTSHKRSMTFVDYVGEVLAHSPEDALKQAQEQFTDAEALAWWVVPADKITKSDPSHETVESWFEPARDKTYKQQQYYATIGSVVSKPKTGRENDDEE
jgi:ring-1,2-phenylacetyl-CoA epoxidase subunit PaaB